MMPRVRRVSGPIASGVVTTASLVAVLTLAASCGSARRDEPLLGPVRLSDREQLGRRVFMHHCYQCHPGGRAGVAPAINDKPLPAMAIRTQVRLGAGAMPAFDDKHINDEELHAVADYLVALRKAE